MLRICVSEEQVVNVTLMGQKRCFLCSEFIVGRVAKPSVEKHGGTVVSSVLPLLHRVCHSSALGDSPPLPRSAEALHRGADEALQFRA